MLIRYTGLGPRELRENGGVRCALHLFKRELVDFAVGCPPF